PETVNGATPPPKLPGEVVATPTVPPLSAKYVLLNEVNCVVDALSNTEVDDATSAYGEPVSAMSVEVAEVVWPQTEVWVNASYEVRPEPVMVIGEEPITVKPVQAAEPAHVTEVVATDWSAPVPDP